MPEIEGYKVVPLRVTPDAEYCHSVYMKEHFIRLMDPNKPKGRTLFLLNVPPYVTEKSLETFFEQVGPVVSVLFAQKAGRDEDQKWMQKVTEFSNAEAPFTFKVAYVVFKNSNSVSRALEVKSIDLFSPTSKESYIVTGMQLWHTQYKDRILDVDKTHAYIDEYMAAYDEREREAAEAAKTTEADADGWVTVGKRGNNAGFEQSEGIIGKIEEKMEKSKKKKELTNFYTFQIRESKMKNIVELRKKFEEDKKKIETLKQTRRFRPF
ncbi:ribosomal RNA-processing protein 7 homolog A [Musca vetustissima]|uniref:ribosomal RNA-processing protein 7 homolog A n=1 Tax=Musca vetustissima TaxID=27455 RepID=UPI002AB6C148|nr:ribosomal RNA-processing protein 7 homolog A [Musca vetustissima]